MYRQRRGASVEVWISRPELREKGITEPGADGGRPRIRILSGDYLNQEGE